MNRSILFLLLVAFLSGCATAPSAYDRQAWGGWRDEDRNCLNTRHEILKERSLVSPTVDRRGCKVLRGKWQDFYSTDVLTKASEIEIDHVVPVKLAHDLGGHQWDQEKKRKFYNDKDNLVITSKFYNRQKGANDILKWQPADKSAACRQMRVWFQVKQKYDLPISKKERNYRNLLGDCSAPSAAKAKSAI